MLLDQGDQYRPGVGLGGGGGGGGALKPHLLIALLWIVLIFQNCMLRYLKSLSNMTGVTTAELQWHQLNMDIISADNQCFPRSSWNLCGYTPTRMDTDIATWLIRTPLLTQCSQDENYHGINHPRSSRISIIDTPLPNQWLNNEWQNEISSAANIATEVTVVES